MRLLPQFLATVLFASVMLQAVAQSPAPVDSTFRAPNNLGPRPIRCGAPIVGLFVAETIVLGASYYAAKPNAYGDKVMGGIWVASAGVMAASTVAESFRRDTMPSRQRQQLVNAVMMAGMTYGFARVGRYNLSGAEGHSTSQRFGRNVLEIHAAYLVPIAAGLLLDRHMSRRAARKRNRATETSWYFTGQSAGWVMRF